jgi:dUTP pyrophosphatase
VMVLFPSSERMLVSTGIAVVLPQRCLWAGPHLVRDSQSNTVSMLGLGSSTQTIRERSKSFSSIMEKKDFEVKKGDRIAQLVLEKCETPLIEEISIVEDTERGSGGFGSTGN